jgi:preprotein translocase SecE subunit
MIGFGFYDWLAWQCESPKNPSVPIDFVPGICYSIIYKTEQGRAPCSFFCLTVSERSSKCEERNVADKPILTTPPGKPTNPKTSDIQRRAQAVVNRKPVSPQTFLKEAWVELKKTTWPSRPILFKSTTVVLALVFAVGVWDFVINVICDRLLNPIFNQVIK